MKGYKMVLAAVFLCFIVTGISAQEGALDSDWQASLPCAGNETRPCGSNVGACEAGTRTCANNVWGECVSGVEPVAEICDNGIDDDCNGLTDECVSSLWIIIAVLGVALIVILWAISKI
jgi:hypothetical protein